MRLQKSPSIVSDKEGTVLRCRVCANVGGNASYRVKEMKHGTREEFDYFRCSQCGCLQIKNVPEDLGAYYPDDYYSFKDYTRVARGLLRRLVHRKRMEYYISGRGILGRFATIRAKVPKYLVWVKETGISRNSWVLDVGSGNGKLLLKMNSDGFQHCIGLDQFVERSINYPNGVKIFKEDFCSFAEKETQKFDLIMFHHSFEHMPTPEKVLEIAAKMLSRDGCILIHLPLCDSHAWDFYREKWVQLDAPRHLYLHTKTSMGLLAESAGLGIEKITYDSSEFQFVGSELYRRDIPLASNRDLKGLFSERELREFKNKALVLNRECQGDQAIFYLCNKRKKQAYLLPDIPLERPASLKGVLGDIDQQMLLEFMGRNRKYPRQNLRQIVEFAVSQNAIHAVEGRFYDGTSETFVSLNTFFQEFSGFIENVIRGESGLSRDEMAAILHSGRRGRHTFRRKLLRFFCSYPAPLGMAELFCRDLDAFIQLADVSPFKPNQVRSEIRQLLDLLAERRPKTVLEVGTNRGGSFYLFSKIADPAATLASVDLKIVNRNLLSSFERKQQRINLVEGDSTSSETIAMIRDLFPDGVDFLFLDGDHSYEGVRKDFENYSSLVRPGGLVAMHDIVEDNKTRYGISTGGWAGGVPTFWREIKKRFRHTEFIDHPEQDGFGIGVLFMPDSQS